VEDLTNMNLTMTERENEQDGWQSIYRRWRVEWGEVSSPTVLVASASSER